MHNNGHTHKMKNILQGFFILIIWNSVFSQKPKNDMVDIAIVEETAVLADTPQLVKGKNAKNKNIVTQEPEVGTGVPEKIEFQVTVVKEQRNTNGGDSVMLNLDKSKGNYETKGVYVSRIDKNGNEILIRENIPVDEGLTQYDDKEKGAVFTVRCIGIEHGDCEPELLGSFYHNGEQYDLEPITSSSPSRVKRMVREKRKNIQRHIKLRRQQKRQFKGSGSKEVKKERKKKKKQKLYLVKKRKKEKRIGRDYNPNGFMRKLKAMNRSRQRQRNKNKNKNKKGQSSSGEMMAADRLAADRFAHDQGLPPTSANKAQPVLEVARMVDSNGSVVMQKTVESSDTTTNSVQRTGATIEYRVELLLVIDFSIYDRFFRMSEKATTAEKDVDAKQKIRYYFAHVVNGIDIRYKQILHSDFTIRVGVVGYYIADNPSRSLWTSGEPSQPRVPVNATRALEELSRWKRTMKSLVEHDHMMLFSGHDLYEFIGGVNDTSVAGFANLGSACFDGGVSLNEDLGDFGSIGTAAHELAHSLDATHDGDPRGASTCSPDDHFVMSPKSGSTTERTKLNPYKFSQCSINSMARYFEELNDRGWNCMKNEVVVFMESEFNDAISTHPGQELGPNKQCERKLGLNSYYGWGGNLGNFGDICTNMACKRTDTATSYFIYSAARGTSCGDKKWCIQGVCTASPDAPPKDENCLFGDSNRLINGKTCAAAISELSGYCYQAFYTKYCCDSCKKAIDNSRPQGCEYGDHTPQCSEIHSDISLCYSNDNICCLTCSKYNSGIDVCKYGDKWSNCEISGCGDKTYAEGCCKTCNLTSSGTTTTPAPTTTTTKATTTTTTTTVAPTVPTNLCLKKGATTHGHSCKDLNDYYAILGTGVCRMDVFSADCCKPCCNEPPFCANLHMSSCYNTTIYNQCKCSCEDFQTGISGCPYGDRIQECQAYLAQYPWFCGSYALWCCTTCNVTAETASTLLTSGQALRKFDQTLDANDISFTPPPLLKENNSTGTTDATTEATTATPSNGNNRVTSFQEILRKRKNKAKRLRKQKNANKRRNRNRVKPPSRNNLANRKKSFQQILRERRKRKRLQALKNRRKSRRDFGRRF